MLDLRNGDPPDAPVLRIAAGGRTFTLGECGGRDSMIEARFACGACGWTAAVRQDVKAWKREAVALLGRHADVCTDGMAAVQAGAARPVHADPDVLGEDLA